MKYLHTHTSKGGKTATGNNLPNEDQNHVLRTFVHRYTGQHRPQWATKYNTPLQFVDDNDWLAHTEFAIDAQGRLVRTIGECHSHPTWPNNPELRKTSQSQAYRSLAKEIS